MRQIYQKQTKHFIITTTTTYSHDMATKIRLMEESSRFTKECNQSVVSEAMNAFPRSVVGTTGEAKFCALL